MQELIKYIGDILNIKTDSVYTIQDMTEELQKVDDIVAYRRFIKMNLQKHEYKTGFQKFILLTNEYIEHINYIKYSEKATLLSLPLFEKVKASVNFVEFNSIEFKNIKLDGKKYFSKDELEILYQAIGGTRQIIDSCKINSLGGQLNSFYMRQQRMKRITNEN